MGFLFTVFYQPFFNLILFSISVAGYAFIGIFLVTLLVKIILLPLSIKMIHTQSKMKSLQGEILEIQKNKRTRQEQAQRIMELYKKNNVNPFSSILGIIIQIPIFIAIYFVLRDMLLFPGDLTAKYSFVNAAEYIDFSFVGIDLLTTGSLSLAVLILLTQFYLIKMTQQKTKGEKKTVKKGNFNFEKQMLYGLPAVASVVSFFIGNIVGFYWLSNNIISIVQDRIILSRIRDSVKS